MELREEQRIALERLCEPGRVFAAIWAEPRSGKTAVALSWIQYIQPKVVVVVGPKIAEGVWRAEAAKWMATPYKFFSLTAGNEYPSLSLVDTVTIMFTNYEQFGTSPFRRLKPFLASLSKWCDGNGMMILDESHMIKSPSAKTGRNIRPLAHQWKYRLLLTGTPVTNPNQIDAVYGQWTFLDPSIRDHWATAKDFREYFGEWNTMKGFPELIRPRHQYELNHYLKPNVITMTTGRDPIEIHKATYSLPEVVKSYHDHMLKEGVISVDGRDVVGLNPLTRLLRMRMIVAGWAKDDEGQEITIKESAQSRLNALGKLLHKSHGKVIVACTHLYEISLVGKYLKSRGIRYISIQGSTKEKSHAIEQFQWDRSTKVLLVQPRTVAMAVDISVADTLIWYTSDFNYVIFAQTSDRIKLSASKPRVWFLMAKGTVDEDVWTTLQEDHSHLRKTVEKIRSGKLASHTSFEK